MSGITDYGGINRYSSLSIYLAILSSTMDEVLVLVAYVNLNHV